jgi:hypothetical protein
MNVTKNLINLPCDILIEICKYIDIYTLSNLTCTNKKVSKIIKENLWNIIDSQIDIVNKINSPSLDNLDNKKLYIPCNKETYENFKYIIDMRAIYFYKKELPLSLIDDLSDSDILNLKIISTYQKLSENQIRKSWIDITLTNLLTYQIIPEDLIIFFINTNRINQEEWYLISKHQKLSYNFIKKYESHINWHALSENKNALNIDIINSYNDKLIWSEITKHGLTEEIIEYYINKLCFFSWRNVACYSNLSINFINKYFDKFDKHTLICRQVLNEEIILKILDTTSVEVLEDFYWPSIAEHQELNIDFIKKHSDNLPIHLMIRNKKIKRQYLKIVYG